MKIEGDKGVIRNDYDFIFQMQGQIFPSKHLTFPYISAWEDNEGTGGSATTLEP